MKKKEMVARLDAIIGQTSQTKALVTDRRKEKKEGFAPSDDLVEGVLCGIAAMSAGAAIMAESETYPTDRSVMEDIAILIDESLKIAENRRKQDEGGIR